MIAHTKSKGYKEFIFHYKVFYYKGNKKRTFYPYGDIRTIRLAL